MKARNFYAATLAAFLAFAGCDSRKRSLEHLASEPAIRENLLETNRLSLTNYFFKDNVLKIGVVSDIEGAIENAHKSAAVLREDGVDIVLIAGDLYENERIRRNPLYPASTNNVKEMIEGIRPYAEIGVPVLLVVGNHEEYNTYTNALALLQKNFPNVHDISQRSADLQGVNVVGLGGYHDARFIAPRGFQLKKEDYARAQREIDELMQQQDPLIFMTHGPPLSNNEIDYVESLGHVGDPRLTFMLSVKYPRQITHIHGHIHEGGGHRMYYPAGFSINVSSVTLFNNNKKKPNNNILNYPKK